VLLEGLGKLKKFKTSSGIEPATFWLVAYCVNHLRYPVFHIKTYVILRIELLIKQKFCMCCDRMNSDTQRGLGISDSRNVILYSAAQYTL
jgi:hypothetical protein